MAAVNVSDGGSTPDGEEACRRVVGDIRALEDASTRFLQAAGDDPVATLVADDIRCIQRALSRSATADPDAAAVPAGEAGPRGPVPRGDGGGSDPSNGPAGS